MEKGFVSPLDEDVPAHYRLWADAETQGVLVHRSVVGVLSNTPESYVSVVGNNYGTDLEFQPYTNGATVWGYESRLRLVDQPDDEWVRYDYPILETEREDGGFDLSPTSASLEFLFWMLQHDHIALADNEYKQGMFVKLTGKKGEFSSIGVTVTPQLARRIEHYFGEEKQCQVERLMSIRWHSLMSMRLVDKNNPMYARVCRARLIEGGRFHLDVPGSRTGLDPDFSSRQELGYELVDHNVDTCHQQLTLLYGLSLIDTLLREEK